MNALLQAREDVADVLIAQAINAYAHDIKSPKENVVIVEPSDNGLYVEKSDVFGKHIVYLDLAVIGKPITVRDCWDALDEHISNVVLALVDINEVEIVSVEKPGVLTWGSKTYVASKVNVTVEINFKEGA